MSFARGIGFAERLSRVIVGNARIGRCAGSRILILFLASERESEEHDAPGGGGGG